MTLQTKSNQYIVNVKWSTWGTRVTDNCKYRMLLWSDLNFLLAYIIHSINTRQLYQYCQLSTIHDQKNSANNSSI